MSNNRFTDPKKWDDDWYLGLSPKMKCAWAYICDNCGSAGEMKLSFSLISFRIGETITKQDFETHFSDQIVWLSTDKIWIVDYIEFQYKNLSIGNAAHRGIMRKVLSLVDGRPLLDPQLTLINGWKEGLETFKDKYKEEDKYKNSEKEFEEKPKSFSPKDLLALWQENRGSLPGVEEFSDERKAKAKTQIAKNPDPNHWLAILERWKKSDFCLEQWKPTFDDWLSKSKRVKTLEGKYDNREKPQTPTNTLDDHARKVLAAIKAIPPGKPDEMKAFLGEELFSNALKIPGGLNAIRQMPANDFTLKKIAGMLKDAT